MSAMIPVHDPLLYDVELPLVRTYFPLGIPFEITTNSEEILAAADESWGAFQKRFSLPTLCARLGVREGRSKICPRPPRLAGQHDLVMHVADEHNFAVSDAKSGSAFAWFTEAAVSKRPYFRYHFLEAIFWMMASPMYLAPVHAACLNFKGKGVLLCGDSGAGKSSLAYACARSGWSYLSDDSSNVLRSRGGRIVIGNPHQIRFRPSAVNLFPELKPLRIAPRVTGKVSMELVTSTVPQIKKLSESPVDYIVFLRRRNGRPRLLRRKKESVVRWFETVICFGSPAVRAAQRVAIHNLLKADIFEMRYSDLDVAIALLESMVHAGISGPFDDARERDLREANAPAC